MELTTLLDELTTKKGSDLHLIVGQPPVFRVNHKLVRREGTLPLDAHQVEALLAPYLPKAENHEITLRHNAQPFRLQLLRERGRIGAVLRALPTDVPTLDDLELGADKFPILQDVLQKTKGLIIVTGPTGSGKSTTIAAMIETINRREAKRIMTLENPIQYEFTSKESVITQSTVGEDIASYPAALRAAFNADVDVLLLGELNNLEAILLALSLVESGHLILTTMHKETASGAVQRLIEAFPDSQQPVIRRMVAQNLVAVVAQKLLRRVDRPGRTAVNEILINSPRVQKMISDGQEDLSVAIEAGREQGMQTMDDALITLFKAGILPFETAWEHLENKQALTLVTGNMENQPPQNE